MRRVFLKKRPQIPETSRYLFRSFIFSDEKIKQLTYAKASVTKEKSRLTILQISGFLDAKFGWIIYQPTA
jgi:hypothetical protein